MHVAGERPRRGRMTAAQARAAAEARAAERAAEERSRRRAMLTVLSLAAFSAVIGLLLGVCGSDLFAVRTVLIDCRDDSITVEASERAAELRWGTVWLPPAAAIEQRIAGLPRVKSVSINRDLPSTLIISIQPRMPSAVVATEGRFMAVDDDGVCLHWTGSAPEELPLVRVEKPFAIEVGGRLSDRDTTLMQAVMKGLVECDRYSGANIDLSRSVRITVVTADGVLGKLGNDELLYEKTLLFCELVEALREKGEAPLYIDLRVPSRPTYKRAE